jgi:Universal stress protein UspA and related nucleotide-binding proteins
MTNKPARIVVGVDGSSSSLQALKWAVDHAVLTGATVQAVIAWQVPNLYGYPVTDGEDWGKDAQQAINVALDTVLGKDSAKVSSTVIQGYPAKVLLDAAAGADLLVVGNRGHSEFTEMLLGSVSQHVVTHATCPVLVMRHVPAA